MGEISNWGNCVARTPTYALARNRRFCPAAPMKKAPTTVLDSMHHCWGPNWHKTTLKQIRWCLMLGTLADDLSCPVPPPSLVQAAATFSSPLYPQLPNSPTPNSQVPSPKSQVPSPKSQVPSPGGPEAVDAVVPAGSRWCCTSSMVTTLLCCRTGSTGCPLCPIGVLIDPVAAVLLDLIGCW